MDLTVVKIGGEVAQNEQLLASTLSQLKNLTASGSKVVIVHGGGPQATKLAEKLGVENRFIDGRRVTSKEMVEVACMTFAGSISSRILAVAAGIDFPLIGISGISGSLICANKRPVTSAGVDYGFVGDIQSINPSPIKNLLTENFSVLVSPLGVSPEGQILNINADTVATKLAISLGAKRLVLLTDVPGVLRNPADKTSLIANLTSKEALELIRTGVISGGMLPKVTTCLDAVAAGLPAAMIAAGASKLANMTGTLITS